MARRLQNSPDIAAKVNKESEKRPEVAEEVEVEEVFPVGDLEEPLGHAQMGGGTNRKKFSDPLDDP